MEKYFEKNMYEGKSLSNLHQVLLKVSGIVASNLFFHEATDHMESKEHRLILAKSAFMLIAICEAIISMVGDGECDDAFDRVNLMVKPIDYDMPLAQLLNMIRDDILK